MRKQAQNATLTCTDSSSQILESDTSSQSQEPAEGFEDSVGVRRLRSQSFCFSPLFNLWKPLRIQGGSWLAGHPLPGAKVKSLPAAHLINLHPTSPLC